MDREKLIRGIDYCRESSFSCPKECPYWDGTKDCMLLDDVQELLEKQEPAIKSSVKQDDIAGIMNAINGALLDNGLHYVATGYDNTGPWLSVMIEKE